MNWWVVDVNMAVEFAGYVAECSGLASSLLISFLAVSSVRPGKDNGALARQALGFLALFTLSFFVYVVI